MLSKMISKKSLDVVSYFIRAYAGRTALLVGLLLLTGVAEGVGVITMLPLLACEWNLHG